MGRRIISLQISAVFIVLIAFMQTGCGNTLLENLKVDVDRTTGNIITIEITGNGETVPANEIIVKKGDTSPVPISATPYTDWAFIQWEGSGVVFNDPYSSDTTLILTGGNTTITAVFGDTTLGVPLMINNNGHGYTNQDGLQYVALGGTTSTLTVYPDTGYELYQSGWVTETGNATVYPVIDGTSYTITINSLLTTIMLADFTIKEYTLTVTNDGNCTTSPDGAVTVQYGVPRSIAASAADPMRYFFKEWSIEDGSVQIGNTGNTSTTATLTAGDAAVKANFKKYGIYWTFMDSAYFHRSSLDFSGLEIIDNTLPCGGIDLDISNKKAYLTGYHGGIYKCDLDGGNFTTLYSTYAYNYAAALDLVNNKLYFANSSTGIGRINLNGSGYEVFVSGPYYRGVAVDAASGYVYLANLGGIYRAPITTGAATFLVSDNGGPFDIDLDLTSGSEKMYWVDYTSGDCRRADLNGANVETLITGLSFPRGIALDTANDRMYITNQQLHSVSEYNLDGTLITSFPVSGSPSGIALDKD